MVEDAFFNFSFVIDVFVRNNDIKMRAVLKHPSKFSIGHVLSSSKVKLDEYIPEPYFSADPSHRMKVVYKHIFSIVKTNRAQQCECTKSDYIQLKKDWGYMVKNNKGETI